MWHSGPLSLSYLTVDGASPTEHLEAAAMAGFDYAGVRIAPPAHLSQTHAVAGNPTRIAQIDAVHQSVGVALLDAEVMCLGPDTTRDDCERLVSAAHELGFRFLQTVIDNDNLGRAAGQLAELAELAEPANIDIALEFMPFRPLQSLPQTIDLISQVGSNGLHLVIDALHLTRSGSTPQDLTGLGDTKIGLVQLCDAPLSGPADLDLVREARSDRLFPGDGEIGLHEILDMIPNGTPLALEVPQADPQGTAFNLQAGRAMERLRGFLNQRETP